MMKIDPLAVAALVVLFLLISLAAMHLKLTLDEPELVSLGAPLHKNSALQLHAGENYTYLYNSTESVMRRSYGVSEGPGCTVISILGEKDSAAVCLDESGERVMGSGSGYGDPTVLLFKPWMLALNDSWRWNSSLYLAFNNSAPQHVSDTSYRVVRRESYMGREAFVVEIQSDLEEPEYQWVDAEKRMTLRIIGEGYEVLLENQS